MYQEQPENINESPQPINQNSLPIHFYHSWLPMKFLSTQSQNVRIIWSTYYFSSYAIEMLDYSCNKYFVKMRTPFYILIFSQFYTYSR